MHNMGRWWARNRWVVVTGSVTIVGVGILKAMNLLPVRELYQFLVQPFQAKPAEIAAQVQSSTAQLQQRIKVLEDKNKALEALLKQPERKGVKKVAALVIGRAADQWWQHVVLNQGQRSQIKVDAIVESSGALVGRVDQVTPSTSQVLLVSDPASRLAVLLSRSRSVGILQGDRNNKGILEFFDQDPDVKVGDQVSTSPLSCLFPPDIPVGIVKSIDRTDKKALQARVDFMVPLDRLEWVHVYHYEKTKKSTSASTSTCP